MLSSEPSASRNLYAIVVASGRRQWQPTPEHLPGKSRGRRTLVGCSPWGHKESDATEQLHFHFSLSCIGEGNGNPLQCSCLEIPRDGRAWWAAIYGAAQSRTRLKQLSSSSSSLFHINFQLFKLLKGKQCISRISVPIPQKNMSSEPCCIICHSVQAPENQGKY